VGAAVRSTHTYRLRPTHSGLAQPACVCESESASSAATCSYRYGRCAACGDGAEVVAVAPRFSPADVQAAEGTRSAPTFLGESTYTW
jgi:hypothetical protein